MLSSTWAVSTAKWIALQWALGEMRLGGALMPKLSRDGVKIYAEGRIMKKLAASIFLMVAISGGTPGPAGAQSPPFGGPFVPSFTAPLSNTTPLSFGMG